MLFTITIFIKTKKKEDGLRRLDIPIRTLYAELDDSENKKEEFIHGENIN